MTALAKTILVVTLLLVATNLFLLFEIHKINGNLSSAQSDINKLESNTSQNQSDINNVKADVFHIYEGGN